ncbi:nuclear transport factor 2 family protein [Kitasatospora viridis]|uniref:SnoaL-like protein n=1 Tax=Kitasatospora viridis TaxID=281105 RepID=A0A561UHC4_9ACTN|nr:nuclear transport factor 2 family protein [Kitasatospora viridis]TWF98753.1 hypothetical protein FHX73_112575 [Kitasatospora viridis]
MNTTTLTDLVTRYLAVWAEPDAARRAAAVAELWAPDAVQLTEEAEFAGHSALTGRVAEAQHAFCAERGWAVTAADDARAHHDCAAFTIQLEQAGERLWAARVFLLLAEDGRIRRDHHLTVQDLQVG